MSVFLSSLKFKLSYNPGVEIAPTTFFVPLLIVLPFVTLMLDAYSSRIVPNVTTNGVYNVLFFPFTFTVFLELFEYLIFISTLPDFPKISSPFTFFPSNL